MHFLMPHVNGAFSDRRQRVRLDGNVSASVDGVSGMLQGSVLLTVVVYIVHLRAILHCWKSYYRQCG